MKRLIHLAALVVIVIGTLHPPCAWCEESAVEAPGNSMSPTPESASPEYRIGPGDVLRVSEWRNEDLTFQVVVLPDGFISFPLIGDIKAAGKTVAEIKAEIEQKLTVYIPEPTVSVMVNNVNSMIIYVIGRANRPGHYPLTTNVTVLQALAMAGGLTPFAKRGDIKVMRREGDKTHIFDFDYDDVSQGENLDQNIVLQRGDVIVVP